MASLWTAPPRLVFPRARPLATLALRFRAAAAAVAVVVAVVVVVAVLQAEAGAGVEVKREVGAGGPCDRAG